MSHVGASMAENMMQTPTSKFSKHWPEPQRFPQFLDKFGKMMSEDYDWSAEIAKLPMPVLLVFADNDSVAQKRITEFFECPRRCSRRFAGRVGAGADLGRVANES